MITRNNALTYYLYRGQQMGFEFELMGKLADNLDLNLEVAVPPGHDELESWLLEGRGDVIASAWTITQDRSDRVAFTQAYQKVDQVVVTRSSETAVKAPRDLNGRTVHVRQSSAYAESLRTLQDSVPNIELEWVDEDVETEEILARVEDGTYDITVCDSNLLKMEQTYGRDLRGACTLATTRLGWAVRPDNPELLQALNSFIAREYRGLHYNMWRKRYFESQKQIARARDELRADASGTLSPYDDLIRKHAHAHNLDWRLVAAVAYQESRFDPDETSWAGAVGLMQMMPRTGRAMGATDLHDPDEALAAGCRYLRSLIDSFDPSLALATRIRFALASYNAGRGHLMDARWLARRQGWNGDQWPDNVERAMLLLEREAYHSQTRYGYCRGSEPVGYVRNVQRWYRVYSQHLPEVTPETG
jgi:membrane-bound lytic murein transglycosylase F